VVGGMNAPTQAVRRDAPHFDLGCLPCLLRRRKCGSIMESGSYDSVEGVI